MGETDRLERLIEAESGDCCRRDLEDRIATLEGFRTTDAAVRRHDLAAMKALGNDTRHDIVRLLVAAGRELCVCEINPVVDVSDSAISHALSDLHDAGLVDRRKDGTWRYYQPTERAEALLAALDETRESRP